MLKLKYLSKNYDLAKEALTHWHHDEEALDEMLSHFRISSNAIYPYCQNGQTRFLRLAPIEEKLEKNVLGEIEFIEYLLKRQYPALRPAPSIAGPLCLRISTQWGEYYACAFQKVSGVPIEDTDFSDKILYEYGKSLARLHTASAEFKPQIQKWTHIEVMNWIEGVLQEYGAPSSAAAALAALRADLAQLPISADQYGLVHYDFELDNVFYDAETQTCSVIDFDDSLYHWYALDLEQVFGCLAEKLAGAALERAKQEFIKGYQSERSYSKEMRLSLPLMRRFIDLYGYARLIRSVAEPLDDEPDWLVDLRNNLESHIAEQEAALSRETIDLRLS